MKVQIFHLFFKPDGAGGVMAADGELYALAVKYAADYLADPVDFTVFKNSWVACEVDDKGKPVRALGLLCMMLRPDFPICRFTDNAAVVKLVQRANDHLHDLYGLRGGEALVHIKKDEAPEARCPDYLDWMTLFDLKPADRWEFKVR
jgi:hypothetical protein